MILKELKKIIREEKIYLNRKLGQNFLIDQNIAHSIVKKADIQSSDTILEIGTGLGALTKVLLDTNANVVSFEVDKKIYFKSKELLENYSNLTLVHKDFLKIDLKDYFTSNFRVIANIPYSISSQIVIKLWYMKESVQDIYILIQKEVGRRFISKTPGNETGFLSILLQLEYDMTIVKNVSREVFYPIPRVDSVYLKLVPKTSKIEPQDRQKFFNFLKFGFSQKRKKLVKVLKKKYPDIENVFDCLSFPHEIRPQKLKTKDWINLWLAISKI